MVGRGVLLGSGACASCSVSTMLAPSKGSCVTPSTFIGALVPVRSSSVGARSQTWTSWSRMAPGSGMEAGWRMIKGVRVPPSHVKRFQSLKGAVPAQAHAQE